jgi:hypothetical protein
MASDLESRMVPLSYIFFLAFLFLIVVVLMNLLNGLAVSDTGTAVKPLISIYMYQLNRAFTGSSMYCYNSIRGATSNIERVAAGLCIKKIRPVLRSRSHKEPHLLVGAGAVTRCGSGSDGSGSNNGIKHGSISCKYDLLVFVVVFFLFFFFFYSIPRYHQ